MGFCAAIRTASFTADTPDRPGAFSLFCCGPQTFARAAAIGREASDHASTLVQMQLKTTDTTTGFGEGHQEHDKTQLHGAERFSRTRAAYREHERSAGAPFEPPRSHTCWTSGAFPDQGGRLHTGDAPPASAR
ncbi:hypothetical protein MHU86_8005 [Fragilaria crotonensis]|nr:hypothetical protein MHU86_8005 [Fragilaria crotonensis]